MSPAGTPDRPSALRRAWRVYADPAESNAAGFLKVMLPLEIALYTYRAWAPEEWPAFSGATAMQVLLWYAALWFVRERDQARAELGSLHSAS